MSKKSKWQDDYWLLLMEIYLQKPVGVKPMYSKKMVDLSLELHIAPNVLFNKMCQIANLETPRIERIWETYGSNPKKLSRAVSLYRSMNGFNNAEDFYEGVEVNESFEKDFRPVGDGIELTPIMLTLILARGAAAGSSHQGEASGGGRCARGVPVLRSLSEAS